MHMHSAESLETISDEITKRMEILRRDWPVTHAHMMRDDEEELEFPQDGSLPIVREIGGLLARAKMFFPEDEE